VWRSADFALPVTNVLAQEIRVAGVQPEKIVVIPNGIDPERFADAQNSETAKSALGLSGRLILGFTGFMRDWHGLSEVLDWMASAQVPKHIHLLLVGDGPALAGLKAQAARLNLADRVTFAGLVERDMVAKMVAVFDIALQPKSVEYASPLKLFEYMALGKAIVAPDQPNIREVLEADVSGVLFDPAEPASMTAAIARLAQDDGLRTRLGAGARNAIEERGYTWKENARRVSALARSIPSP